MKKVLLFLLLTASICGQNPTKLDNGLRLPNATVNTTDPYIATMSEDGSVNKIDKSDLQDYIEYSTASALPVLGTLGKLYGVTDDPSVLYRWNGVIYVEIGAETDLSGYELISNKVDVIEDSSTTYPSSAVVYGVDERLQAVEGVTSVENGKIPNSKITSQYGNLGELVNQNLASTTTYTSGYFINWLTGVSTVNAIYSHTGYMPVKAGEKYRWYQKNTEPNDDGNAIGALYGAYYDESGVFVSGINITATDTVITVPSGVASVRVTYSNSANAGNFYFYRVLNYTSYGDSITAQNTWQPLLSEYLSLYHTVDGYGGARIAGSDTSALNQDTRLLTISSNADIITVMGGTNDWAASIELGEETSTDVETFYGALNSLFYKLKTNYPNALIIALATPYGEYPDRVYFDDKVGILNNEGLSTVDYGNALITAAKNNHIRFVATHKLWDTDNITNFITYDGAYLHPNALGGIELASKISLDIIQDVLKLRTETKESLANKVSVITTASTTSYPNVTAVRTVAGGVTLNTIPRSNADGTLKDSGLSDDGTTVSSSRKLYVTGNLDATGEATFGTTGSAGGIVFRRGTDGANNFTYGFASSTDNSEIRASHGTGAGYYTWYTNNASATAERMRLDASGNLSIGSTSAGAYKLLVSGAVGATSFNGVALTTANATTTYLNGAGGYTTPTATSSTWKLVASYNKWTLTTLNTWYSWGRNTSYILDTTPATSLGTGSSFTASSFADCNFIPVIGASKLLSLDLSMRNVGSSYTFQFYLASFDLPYGDNARGYETNYQVLINETFTIGTADYGWLKSLTIATHTLNTNSGLFIAVRCTSAANPSSLQEPTLTFKFQE